MQLRVCVAVLGLVVAAAGGVAAQSPFTFGLGGSLTVPVMTPPRGIRIVRPPTSCPSVTAIGAPRMEPGTAPRIVST